MTTLLELHAQHFVPRTGEFRHKPTANIVRERILSVLRLAVSVNLNDNVVQVIGKHSYTIELPLIRHVWWPRTNDKIGLGHELSEVVSLMLQSHKEMAG